jgi:hypothetical protein
MTTLTIAVSEGTEDRPNAAMLPTDREPPSAPGRVDELTGA